MPNCLPTPYLQLFKGAWLPCLVAFTLADHPLTIPDLIQITGYEHPEVVAAVLALRSSNIILRIGYAQFKFAKWILSLEYDSLEEMINALADQLDVSLNPPSVPITTIIRPAQTAQAPTSPPKAHRS